MIRRAVVFAILALLVAAAVLGTSRLVDLRYVNVPLLHPYPPSGYDQNPFNPSDRSDLIPSAEAARVKSDLLEDGKIEVAAAATGDGTRLATAETGRSLSNLTKLLDNDAAQGLFEKSKTDHRLVVVGHLADPNDPSIKWCVEERGTGSLTQVRRDTGAVVSTRVFQFVGRFWLTNKGGHYLIADRLVTEE